MRDAAHVWLACLMAMAGGMAARGGEVWTTDGRSFSGAVRVESDGTISVSSNGAGRLKAEDILYAWFGSVRPPSPGGETTVGLIPQAVGAAKPGTVVQNNGVYSFKGLGQTISGTADDLSLFSRGTSSDVQVIARIREISPSGAIAGLMVRSDMDPGSPFAMIGANSTGDVVFRYRTDAGGKPREQGAGKLKFPIWFKLVRHGRNCWWYKSKTGLAWVLGGQVIPDRQLAEWNNSDRRSPEPGLNLSDRASAGVAILANGPAEARATLDKMRLQDLEPETKGVVKAPVEGAITFVPARLAETAKGVWLSDGSFLPRAGIVSLDDRSVKIEEGPGKETTIPVGRMARVNLTPITTQLAASIPANTSGVLLSSAGFMEGQIKAWKSDKITVSSIVFGLSSFKPGDEVRAVSWRTPTERVSNDVVMLSDGTSLAATALRSEQLELVVAGPTLGTRRVQTKDLAMIRASVDRAVPLANLRPQKMLGPAGENVVAGTAMDPVWGTLLVSAGRSAAFGVVMPVSAEVTYDIPPGCKRLTCWVAVPDQGGAGGTINFAVDVDGKSVTKQQPVKVQEGHPMAVLSVPVEGKTLTLRADADGKDSDVGYVIWGDALLSK